MPNSLEIKQLSVAFNSSKKTIKALDKISFTLTPGKTLVLLGESGCGKSLTSLALMRLLPKSGVYGLESKVLLENSDILNLPEEMMRHLRGRRLAMIFQEPMTALNPVMTIGEQIAEVLLKQQAYTKAELTTQLIALLSEVEMPQPEVKIHQYPHQLSGGQKQRVVIAMALACNPDILIADEPTTALDVTIQAQILALLKKLQKTYHMSLLLITHDLGVVKAMADTVCVMYAGQVVEQSSVEQFFSHIGHPYVQQLLASLPSRLKRDEQLSTITGHVPTLEALPSGCRFHPRCIYAFKRCEQEEPKLCSQQLDFRPGATERTEGGCAQYMTDGEKGGNNTENSNAKSIQQVSNRLIRCHLYPELEELPPLPKNQLAWKERYNEEPTLLVVNNLSIEFIQKNSLFKNKKIIFKAVDDLSFSLKKGKTLALVGESGCGKTTTSRALLRLIPTSGGEIYYQGQNILALKRKALREYRKKVQIIFQDPFSSMNPRMTVGEIIAEGMKAHGMNSSFISHRQKELLEQVHLPSTSLQRYPHQFSGGQRQRICIARALATAPEVLICDEPTSALDVSVQAQIINLLKELQQETGIAYLFITHNMGVVSYLADEVIVMNQGKAVECGDYEQIFTQPKHPYTKKLLNSVLDIV